MYRGGSGNRNRRTPPLYFDWDSLLVALILVLIIVHEASISPKSLRLCLPVPVSITEETRVIIEIIIFFISL